MKKRPFISTRRAITDIEEIWLYTFGKWSVEQAYRYYHLIFEEINYICKNVNAGKVMDHVRKGYRATKIKSHFIFYSVVNETVEIIRILHERMNIENRFQD